MRNIRTIVVSGGILLGLGSCTPTGTPIYILATPRFVPQSPPDSSTDIGIGEDSKTTGNNILLQWYASQGAMSYNVWRTDSVTPNGSPSAFLRVNTSPIADTVYSDPVQVGVPYYYYLTAVGQTGNGESNPSDTLRYTLVARPLLQYPGPNSPMKTNNLTFAWQQDPTFGGRAVVRVEEASAGTIIWISQRFWSYNSAGSIAFDVDGRATARLIQGISYRWRVDLFVDSTQGAKSMWQTFVVN